MNELEQFKNLLSSLDLGENKESLLTAFENASRAVGGLVNDLKANLSEERDKTAPLKEKNREFLAAIGLKENATIDEVKAFKESLANSKKLDELKQQYETKYNEDTEKLRSLLEEKDNSIKSINGEYENLLFKTNIIDKGYLKPFKNNPLVQNLIIENAKSKILFKDGQMYRNDGTGNIQIDITTGKPMPVDTVFKELENDENYKDFLESRVTANSSGFGSRPQTQTPATQQGGQKPQTTEAFIRDALSGI